jgi:hypothetical protein
MDAGANDPVQLRVRIVRERQGQVGGVENAIERPSPCYGRALQGWPMTPGAAQHSAKARAMLDDIRWRVGVRAIETRFLRAMTGSQNKAQ